MPMELRVNDRVEMKKPHPCGARLWTVAEVGAELRLCCTGCGREVRLPRWKAEKGMKKIWREEKT